MFITLSSNISINSNHISLHKCLLWLDKKIHKTYSSNFINKYILNKYIFTNICSINITSNHITSISEIQKKLFNKHNKIKINICIYKFISMIAEVFSVSLEFINWSLIVFHILTSTKIRKLTFSLRWNFMRSQPLPLQKD